MKYHMTYWLIESSQPGSPLYWYRDKKTSQWGWTSVANAAEWYDTEEDARKAFEGLVGEVRFAQHQFNVGNPLPCPRRYDPFAANIGDPAADTWRGEGTCDYCGSVSPEMFFDYISEGGEVTGSDKNYKIYLHGLDAKVRGAGKFYWQHLDQPGRDLFIKMHNAGKINYEKQFGLYVKPFFCQALPKA